MKTVIDKANTRGYFNHGWLKPTIHSALQTIIIQDEFTSVLYAY